MMQVVVLSPHRDDAAFSCGLVLQRLVEARAAVTIVNICTISSYAPYLTQDLQDRTAQVTAVRAEEDRVFIGLLNQAAPAQVELVDLAWQDVPLRWQEPDDIALGALPLRQGEVLALSTGLQPWCQAALVLAPAAIGDHADHRLVRSAALQTFPAASLLFYEDLPYASRAAAAERLAQMPEFCTHHAWMPLDDQPSASKREFALCYPSQIAPEVASEMADYAAQHGGRECFAGSVEALGRLRQLLKNQVVAA